MRKEYQFNSIIVKNCHAFITPQQGKYIVGYTYNNGYRDVYKYVVKIYHGEYTYHTDYIHAKKLSLATAKKHAAAIDDYIHFFRMKTEHTGKGDRYIWE